MILNFKFLKIFKKLKILYLLIIFSAFVILIFSQGQIHSQKTLKYGITFSEKQAEDLGLDWQETYLAILNDLQVKKIRLSAYWDEVEKENNIFSWNKLDWLLEESSKHETEIIVAIGGRLPRWPECHFPNWAKKLEETDRQKETLSYIKASIERYKNNKNIVAWQIENEPFLSNFGECPSFNSKFLDQEIALVKELDNRPIIITDSGELSLWVPASKRADIFGTTMYRNTYSQTLQSYIHYPIKPGFFRFKKNLAKLFSSPDKWIVIEMQAEPWGPIPFQGLSQEERDKTMSLQKFKEMLEFSQKTGFKEFYLWGAEWWYWEKTTQNNAIFWNEAKKLF